jgi:hypothetical protein
MSDSLRTRIPGSPGDNCSQYAVHCKLLKKGTHMTRMTPQQCLPIPQFRKEVRWKRIGVWLAFRLPGCLHDWLTSGRGTWQFFFFLFIWQVSYRLMNIGDNQPPAQHAIQRIRCVPGIVSIIIRSSRVPLPDSCRTCGLDLHLKSHLVLHFIREFGCHL